MEGEEGRSGIYRVPDRLKKAPIRERAKWLLTKPIPNDEMILAYCLISREMIRELLEES